MIAVSGGDGYSGGSTLRSTGPRSGAAGRNTYDTRESVISSTRLRAIGTLAVLAALAGPIAACETSSEPTAGASTGPTTDVAANSRTVCGGALESVKAGFVAMADDAIAQIDKPVSEAEQDRLIRERYTTVLTGLRTHASQAADPAVRTAFENLATAIEQRLADQKPMAVDEPGLKQPLEAVDTACGN